MTPEVLQALASLLERYGLPLALLIGLGWLLLTRRLTLGSETSYVEARRLEEREGRVTAERALQETASALGRLTDAIETLTDLVEDRRGRR